MRLNCNAFKNICHKRNNHSSTRLIITCWICMIGGVPGYIYNAYTLADWANWMVTDSPIFNAMACFHISLRLLCLWVPFAILLTYWQVTNKIVVSVYCIGCALCITFSIVATSLLNPYKVSGQVRKEYLAASNKYLLEYNDLPHWVIKGSKEQGCCGWSGPEEFGARGRGVDITHVRDDPEFLAKLARTCFSGIIDVNGSQIVSTKLMKGTFMPGCNLFYKKRAYKICYFTALMGIFVDILAGTVLFLYLRLHKIGFFKDAQPAAAGEE